MIQLGILATLAQDQSSFSWHLHGGSQPSFIPVPDDALFWLLWVQKNPSDPGPLTAKIAMKLVFLGFIV